MDREAWRAAIHGVAKNRTWLSDLTELNCWLSVRTAIYVAFQCDPSYPTSQLYSSLENSLQSLWKPAIWQPLEAEEHGWSSFRAPFSDYCQYLAFLVVPWKILCIRLAISPNLEISQCRVFSPGMFVKNCQRKREREKTLKKGGGRERETKEGTSLPNLQRNKNTIKIYANKWDNIHEMDRFTEKHKLLKLTLKELDNLNRLTASKEIEWIIFKSYPQRKARVHIISLLNCTKCLKKN